MPILRLSRLAEQDLAQIADYIARDKPSAAEAFILEIMRRCELLAASPMIGRDRSDLRANTRSFPVGHYVVFFETIPSGIKVLRVLHSARDTAPL